MTNLLEKSLLLGFSIFLLTIFSSILIPFLDEITEFNKQEKNTLETYIGFLDEINDAVLYIIENPEESYLKDIQYPSNLNLTLFDSFIISEFIIGSNVYNKVSSYNGSFINCFFHDFPPKTYILNVSYLLSNIILDFIDSY
jgi:predicted PurR-regulated permease PerM